MRVAYDRAGDILVVDLGQLSESPGAREVAKLGRDWMVTPYALQAYLTSCRRTKKPSGAVAERAGEACVPGL